MAIAFDTATNYDSGGNESTSTISHTATGSNLCVVVVIRRNTTGDDVSGVTWNGTAMARIGSYINGGAAGDSGYVYAIVNAASGTHDVVISCVSASFGTNARVGSYTGVATTGLPDATAQNGPNAAATTLTQSVTTVADNCWVIALMRNTAGDFTAGANTTLRLTGNALSLADTNAAQTPAGAHSLTATHGLAIDYIIAFSIAPFAAPAGVAQTNLLSLLGVGT